jgi:transposase
LLKQRRELGTLAPKVRQEQSKPKLGPDHCQLLKELVEENNDATLEELAAFVQEKTQILVGKSTIDRTLKRLGITRKKKTLTPSAKGSQRVQSERFEYWQTVSELPVEDFIFIDESGLHLAMTRTHARSERGDRARGEVPNRGTNISLIGAISLNGLVSYAAFVGSVNAITFEETFIAEALVPNLWEGAYVIMDNCSIHLGEAVERQIRAAGTYLIYLPPYSPDFSPIENCWSKLKNILRRIGARTRPDLYKAIEEAFEQISLDDFRAWFTHCCYCTSPA